MDGCFFTSSVLVFLYAVEVCSNLRKERRLIQRLTQACAAGDLQTVRDCLPDVNVEGSHHQMLLSKKGVAHGGTFLHEAASSSSGSPAVITWLLDHGADLDSRDASHMTPLHVAALYANLPAIKCLVERGADLTAEDGDGHTALMLAKCSSLPESDEVLKYLQARGQAVEGLVAVGETRELPSGVRVPDEFFCPLTLDVFKDPVVAEDGMSYERAAITGWVKANNNTTTTLISPLLHTPMGPTLRPNTTLRKLIQDMLDNNLAIFHPTDRTPPSHSGSSHGPSGPPILIPGNNR